jgi:CheY-like chemotaxis protein
MQLFDAIACAIGAPDAPRPKPVSQASNADIDLQPDYSSKRVLVVEDNPVNLKVIQAMLSKLKLKPDVAENGQLALNKLSQQHYDLILMDCQMPVLDGYEATSQFRQQEAINNRPRTPVIALTAHATNEARETCLAAGMDDYLSKPINRQDLTAMLERWLNPANHSA